MSVYKRGDVWWFKFRFAGRVVRESAKTGSKTVAREAERNRRRELENSWNQIKRRELPPRLDVAADRWLAAVKPHIAERTYDIYSVALRCHLNPALGSILVCDLDASRIACYQAKRKSDGASARTLNKELQVLRQLLKRHKLWANLQGDVKFERESDRVGKALSRQEEELLLRRCESNLLLHSVVTLALNTGLRKNEIRTLQWGQIDLFKRTLTVGKTKTEAGSWRLIPLNADAYTALVKWAARLQKTLAEHYVFPACENARINEDDPDTAKIDASRPIKSWRTAWRSITRAIDCPQCGDFQVPAETCANEECKADLSKVKSPLAGLRFHDLRHSCITKLAEGQASEQTIMAIAGHVSRRMLEHYSHIRTEAKRAALDAIAGKPGDFQVSGAQNWAHSPAEEKSAAAN